nr:hypothetical protein CFP56_42080 [Quercus suber]
MLEMRTVTDETQAEQHLQHATSVILRTECNLDLTSPRHDDLAPFFKYSTQASRGSERNTLKLLLQLSSGYWILCNVFITYECDKLLPSPV